jgi:tripartite-type tricarboxylate transporter receptor subunit TctC
MNVSRFSLAAGLAAAPLLALAQGTPAYPSKPVTVIVPFAAGGPTDSEARIYAGKLSTMLGQQFVTDYKPGAGTTIGTRHVGKAAPDGYTILTVTGTFTTINSLYPNLDVDSIRDFAPLSQMSAQPQSMLARPSFPAKDFGEYVSYVKANPGKLTWGTAGAGSITHLVGAWMNGMIDGKITFVHYKGTAGITLDLMGDRLDVGLQFLSASVPPIKAGKLKLLAVLGKERSSLFPNLPSPHERGLPGFDFANWLGIVAPAKTPPAVIERLSSSLARIARMPDVASGLESAGAAPVGSTPAQFGALIRSESERWAKVVRDNGIKIEE